jgi:hypothetical protein
VIPVHRYTPVEMTVEVRDADELRYLKQVQELSLDVINQGGVTNLQVVNSTIQG